MDSPSYLPLLSWVTASIVSKREIKSIDFFFFLLESCSGSECRRLVSSFWLDFSTFKTPRCFWPPWVGRRAEASVQAAYSCQHQGHADQWHWWVGQLGWECRMKEFVGVSWGWEERKCTGLTGGKWLLCWNRCFNKHRQVLEEKNENFRYFPVVQVLLMGLGSSGVLLDGNQHSGFWILGVLWLWRPERAYLSCCLPADGDGKCELVVGYTDRVVRAFRWEDLSENSDHVSGQLILLKKWLLEGQVRKWGKRHKISVLSTRRLLSWWLERRFAPWLSCAYREAHGMVWEMGSYSHLTREHCPLGCS